MQSEAMSGVFYLRPVFFVAVAFVIFFVLFGRTLWKMITGLLDKRIDAVKTELAEAARLRTEAEAMLEQARTQRQQAMEQSARLIQSAKQEAERLSAAMAEESQVAATRRERMAMERIGAAEKAVIAELRQSAIAIAAAAAGQVLAAGFSAEQDGAVIDRSIAALPASLRAAA